MKKAFDQTVRELKREVNKKVLKVPGVEQKILDATSNETWGPHGSLLADIAQATRNFHEYQIIMHVIWKRLNDTGRNWRHVYKALTVLEYLIGYGSERVIDDIREHAYQISTLSDFQYIDSSGKDQGNNVRRKSQTLVSLVNDKEKIHEVRQKALANKDKFRATFSSSGSSRPGHGDRYDDDRYGSRDDDQNGIGRGRDSGYRDDDNYARGGEFNRDGDEFGRGSDENSERGNYKNDDIRGGRGNDDSQFGPRSRSFDKDRDHSFEEDDSSSYRNNGGRANNASPDNRNLEPKLSEQNSRAPPSYESAIRKDNNVVQDEREVVGVAAPVPKALSLAPPLASSQKNHHAEQHAVAGAHSPSTSMNDTSFDEFDPRGFTPAVNFAPRTASSAPPATFGSAVNLFDSPSLLDPANSLALVLTSSSISTDETEAGTTNSGFGGSHFVALSSASAKLSQPSEDPFGDCPFKAVPHENFPIQRQSSLPVPSTTAFYHPSMSTTEPIAPVGSMTETSLDFGFGDSLGGLMYTPAASNDQLHSAYPTLTASELAPAQSSIDAMSARPGHFQTNTVYNHSPFMLPGFDAVSLPVARPFVSTNVQIDQKGFYPHRPTIPHASAHMPMQAAQPMSAAHMNLTQQPTLSSLTQRASATISGPSTAKPSNDTFETKSSVWADTLNRGLVNLNISGSKTNPLADIGVDFDSINRLERRKEKERGAANPLTSNIAMGKAMGSGSGIVRAGTVPINPAARPTIGSGMGMAMPLGHSAPGMGGLGGMSMGISGNYSSTMNPPMGGGMGMNMGMGLGGPMRPHPEMQSAPPNFPGSGYNSMGMGGYASDRWRSQ